MRCSWTRGVLPTVCSMVLYTDAILPERPCSDPDAHVRSVSRKKGKPRERGVCLSTEEPCCVYFFALSSAFAAAASFFAWAAASFFALASAAAASFLALAAAALSSFALALAALSAAAFSALVGVAPLVAAAPALVESALALAASAFALPAFQPSPWRRRFSLWLRPPSPWLRLPSPWLSLPCPPRPFLSWSSWHLCPWRPWPPPRRCLPQHRPLRLPQALPPARRSWPRAQVRGWAPRFSRGRQRATASMLR